MVDIWHWFCACFFRTFLTFNSIGLAAVVVFLLLQKKTATAGNVPFYAISFKFCLLSLPVFYLLTEFNDLFSSFSSKTYSINRTLKLAGHLYVPTLLSEGHLNETTDYSPSLYNISASFNSFCVIRFLSATVPADLFHVSIKFELLGRSTMVKHHVCLYLLLFLLLQSSKDISFNVRL